MPVVVSASESVASLPTFWGLECIAAGIDEFDGVGARDEAREEVGTGGVCGGGGDHAADGIEQVDGDIIDPGFAGILDAVGVEVIPDEVAEGGEG